MFVVVEKDCYMGDGDDSPTWGFAGVDNVFGPFPDQKSADDFAKVKDKASSFSQFDVYELKAPV